LQEDATEEGKGVREVEMVQEEKEARGKNNVKGSRDVNNMGRKWRKWMNLGKGKVNKEEKKGRWRLRNKIKFLLSFTTLATWFCFPNQICPESSWLGLENRSKSTQLINDDIRSLFAFILWAQRKEKSKQGLREDERGSEKGKNTKERKERRLKKKGKKPTERKERRLKKKRKEVEPIYENTRIRNSKNPEWGMYIRRNRKQNVRDEGTE
jgi:hypothetical protein